MKDVDVNGVIHRFPDSMSDDEIRSVLRSKYVSRPDLMTHQTSAQAKPIKPTGSLSDFASGLGQGFSDLGRGIQQRAVDIGTLTGGLPPFVRARLRKEEGDIRQERDYGAKDTLAGAFGRGTAITVPGIAASFIPGGQSLPASTLASALTGAGVGAMLPTTSGAETGMNMMVGAGGSAAGNLLGRALLPTGARTMTQSQKEILDIARREGIPLRTSEATGSAAIKNFEQMAANRPITAGMEQRFNEAQTKAINEAITRRLGKPVAELNPATLDQFGREIGSKVGEHVKGKTVDLTKDFFSSIVKVDSEFSKGGRLTMTPQIRGVVDDAVDLIASKKQVSGEVAQAIKSKLQDRMRDAFNQENAELGNALRTVVKGLDDALDKSMSAAEQEAWRTARRQYANYKIVEDVMSRPTRIGALGDIPANRLASALERSMGTSYAKGKADLADIARLGQVIQPPGRSALLGESGIPYIRNVQDMNRVLAMPLLQSRATQNYLTGGFPLQRALRDASPMTQQSVDALLRAAGLDIGLLQPSTE